MHELRGPERPSNTTIGIVLSLLIQFGSIVWFASSLSTRMDKIEQTQAALQQRYEHEVIPRADLGERLDRIEKQLDTIVNQVMQQSRAIQAATR